jgi:alkylation response protein AidB-like acyl-CoA dehydrogenase
MNMDLDETQSLLQETVRGYLEREVPFDRIRELEREQRWDATLWKELCEQGWLGLPFSDDVSGGGGSLVDLGLLVEEFARRAAMVPLLEVVVAGRAMAASEGMSHALVSELLEGTCLPVPALLEAGDRFEDVALVVGQGGRLSGEKRFVDYGQFATHHLVAARDGGGTALFLVDARAPGVHCEPLRSIGRTPVCDARYDGAAAERVAGAEAHATLIRLGRTLAAVQCVGSMQQALDMTVQYARVREQFGKPIGSFQAVRHHCANMASRIASARFLALEALSAMDAGTASDAQIAAAKASASRAAPEVLMLGHQVHGGNGVIEENDLYFFTLRGKERSLAWGSVDECLAVMASSLETKIDWI